MSDKLSQKRSLSKASAQIDAQDPRKVDAAAKQLANDSCTEETKPYAELVVQLGS